MSKAKETQTQAQQQSISAQVGSSLLEQAIVATKQTERYDFMG
jgi:hypothetical protein